MKRTIHTDLIKKEIEKLIYNASFTVPPEIKSAFSGMKLSETGPLASETLRILIENAEISEKEEIPLCQDCGSTIIFMEIGQDIEFEGEYICDAVNEAVADSYIKFHLRKSIVSDPLRRTNTGTNTPAFIHTDIIPGDRLKIDILLKGGGSENVSSLRMFRPTDPVEMIIDYIEDTVIKAGPNPCPPIFLGVGIGGTADAAMLNSKKALMRPTGEKHKDPFYAELEDKILARINSTGVGPMGFGGANTAAGVCIMEAPTHIASLPVALNLNCHSFRKGGVIL
ncbi:MAG TPA: fumarate hydratase [Spirochaetota bacterium]|nr:fumarate hydratase [Spirochaetota bacterium]